jgi:hypothetical protein
MKIRTAIQIFSLNIAPGTFSAICENNDVFCETFTIENVVFLHCQIGYDNKYNIKQRKPIRYARIYR